METRLELINRGLVESLRSASEARQRGVARQAVHTALDRNGLSDHPVIVRGLQALEEGRFVSPEKADVEGLAVELEGEYGALHHAADLSWDKDVDRAFCRARAAESLVLALGLDPFEAAHNALYEAHTALGEDETVLRLASAALTSG
jgi:predicted transcriptional regulator